ncbi:LytR/AlgR family response regulator transcription factor [Paenibacillus abyssi]|uniref:DNA-binding response regulator n=1 Tax=Paenibacillus abyssi TaxID=1340531 RepID=A0A917G6U8_9BACL|nr:LytTR family DNA-binding domain-containing protein [Paenibacillus abyssi]GGG25620.1 DNA-binding response regulator [Paenibacillus abyssi]
MDKARIVIVDDNEDSLDILQFYIEQLPDFSIVDRCVNGEELIDSVMRTNPDVILLDINMPKLNGVDAIQSCLRIKSDLIFIFITSYNEYAVQAFELSALDYLVKPIEKTRLYAALEKVKKTRKYAALQEKSNPYPGQRLFIKDNNDYYYIPQLDILFIEKVGKKCHIYTADHTYTTNETIGSIMNQLPKSIFFMSHRSYILNLTKISHIKANNQTYLAYFLNTNKYAHISKLKIDELQTKLKLLN